MTLQKVDTKIKHDYENDMECSPRREVLVVTLTFDFLLLIPLQIVRHKLLVFDFSGKDI